MSRRTGRAWTLVRHRTRSRLSAPSLTAPSSCFTSCTRGSRTTNLKLPRVVHRRLSHRRAGLKEVLQGHHQPARLRIRADGSAGVARRQGLPAVRPGLPQGDHQARPKRRPSGGVDSALRESPRDGPTYSFFSRFFPVFFPVFPLSRPLLPTDQGGLARAPISAMPVSAAPATRAEALTLHPASSITNTPAQVAAHRLRLSQARSAASSSSAAGTIAEISPGEFVVIQTTGASSTLVLVDGTVPPGADSKLPTTKLAVRWWTWVSAKQTYVPWLKAGRQERTEELRASVALTGVTATPGSKLKGPLKKQWLKLTLESRLALAEIAEKAGSDSSGSSGDEGSDEDEERSEST